MGARHGGAAGHEGGGARRHRRGQDLAHPQVGRMAGSLARYVDDEYVPDYRITVDLDFWQKKLRLSPDRHLNLQVVLKVLGGEMVKWWFK